MMQDAMLAATPRLVLLGVLFVLPGLLPAQIVPPLPKNPLGRPKPAPTNAEAPPAAVPRPYAGTFVGQDLTLELAWIDARSRYEGTVVHEGERMPCQGNPRGDGFAGTFLSEGQEYGFTLQITGDKATVVSGGQSYSLMRRPGPGTPTPAPRPGNGNAAVGGCGLAFQPNDAGELVVAGVAPGGAAERAKVPVGAVLRAVDGKKVAGMSMEQVRQLCIGPVGSMVTLTFETPREVLDFVLQRQPLPQPAGGEAPQRTVAATHRPTAATRRLPLQHSATSPPGCDPVRA